MKLPFLELLTKQHIRCIYDEVACFSFRRHIVLLCVCKFQIQVQVCNLANTIEANILIEIKSMLESTMEEFLTQTYRFDIGYKCINGKFHDEGFNFISEMDLKDDKKLCGFCLDYHELGNGIDWVNLISILFLFTEKPILFLKKMYDLFSIFIVKVLPKQQTRDSGKTYGLYMLL